MIRDLGAYLRERFHLSIFGPAIALHVTGALWANGATPEPAAIIYCAGLATLLLLQFRLWDDLEDRERDRAAHPDRVLVCASPSPFWRLLAALCLANVALMAASGSRSAPGGLALLNLAFWLAYRRMRPRLPDFVWRFQVLLFKYPAFVGLLATAIGTPLAGRSMAAALTVYATACGYEVLHDRRIQIGAIS